MPGKEHPLNSTDHALSEAQRFLDEHGVGSLPGARFENGESADSQRSEFFGGADRARTRTGGSHGKYVRLEPPHDTDEGWEEWMQAEGLPYVPLVGSGTATLEQLEKRARLRHVLTFMLPMHVELLWERHVIQRTLDDIAAEHCVTRQAIIKRLEVASQDFKRLFAQHWNDAIDWKEQLTERDAEG